MSPRLKVPLIVAAALILHQSVLAAIRIVEVRPELTLLVAVAAGLVAGSERGAVVGFLAGLLTDVFLPTPLGLTALTFALVAFAVGMVQSSIVRSAWWITPVVAFLASAAGVLLYVLLGAILGRSQFVGLHALVVAGVAGGLNAVLSPLVVKAMAWAMTEPSEGAYAR